MVPRHVTGTAVCLAGLLALGCDSRDSQQNRSAIAHNQQSGPIEVNRQFFDLIGKECEIEGITDGTADPTKGGLRVLYVRDRPSGQLIPNVCIEEEPTRWVGTGDVIRARILICGAFLEPEFHELMPQNYASGTIQLVGRFVGEPALCSTKVEDYRSAAAGASQTSTRPLGQHVDISGRVVVRGDWIGLAEIEGGQGVLPDQVSLKSEWIRSDQLKEGTRVRVRGMIEGIWRFDGEKTEFGVWIDWPADVTPA